MEFNKAGSFSCKYVLWKKVHSMYSLPYLRVDMNMYSLPYLRVDMNMVFLCYWEVIHLWVSYADTYSKRVISNITDVFFS